MQAEVKVILRLATSLLKDSKELIKLYIWSNWLERDKEPC